MGQRTKNSSVIRGNVGNNPEIRMTDAGKKVASFSIATHDNWTDRNGQKREDTEWHKIVVFAPSIDKDGLAGVVEKYVHKGSFVEVRGKSKTRKWTDNEGIERMTTEVIVDDIDLLDRKEQG